MFPLHNANLLTSTIRFSVHNNGVYHRPAACGRRYILGILPFQRHELSVLHRMYQWHTSWIQLCESNLVRLCHQTLKSNIASQPVNSSDHPVYPSCGTQLLVRNTGALPYTTLTHPWCFPLGAPSNILYYENSPTAQAVTNTAGIITGNDGSGATTDAATLTGGVGPTTVFVGPTQTVTQAPNPSPSSSSSSTPVGAIVGGAVGGVAILAIVAGVVIVLLHRKKQQIIAAQVQATTPLPAYDPKRASQVSSPSVQREPGEVTADSY